MVGESPSARKTPQFVIPGRWCSTNIRLRRNRRLVGVWVSCILALTILWIPYNVQGATGSELTGKPVRSVRTTIPILGTTKDDHDEPIGIVADIQLEFTQRGDHKGLEIKFQRSPGRFSPYAQQSVIQAIHRVVQAAHMNPDSWTVQFVLPYPGVTLYGESLSAMAALNVVALARNEPVDEKTILTGTVTPDGHVGTVGGVPLKIVAAHQQHFRRVLIPEIPDVADGDWQTPFLMEVTPIRSINKAYLALTNRPLQASLKSQTSQLTR